MECACTAKPGFAPAPLLRALAPGRPDQTCHSIPAPSDSLCIAARAGYTAPGIPRSREALRASAAMMDLRRPLLAPQRDGAAAVSLTKLACCPVSIKTLAF